MTQLNPSDQPTAAYANVLTDAATGDAIGYHLMGGFAGPTLAVLGHGALAEQAYGRLMALESLPWMHGSLLLFLIDGHTHLHDLMRQADLAGPVDRVMILPEDNAQRDTRWTHLPVLRMCASLGMISGRGLPPINPGLRVIYG